MAGQGAVVRQHHQSYADRHGGVLHDMDVSATRSGQLLAARVAMHDGSE